ncbi:zinc finger domain-containing protein [Streptomyces sp. NPDC055025]
MTPDETVVLARYVRALCPQQKFDEYTPDAWHDVLGDWPLSAARAAAAAVAKQQPFVSPAEIIGEIRKQRDAKADSFQGPGLPAEIPDADPDDVPAYLAALREQRTRAADGQELKRRPVAELISGVVSSFGVVPGSDTEEAPSVRRPGALCVECPVCHAAIGRPCRLKLQGGARHELRKPHSARGRVARGEPATTESPEEIERRRAVSLAHLDRLAADEVETLGEPS